MSWTYENYIKKDKSTTVSKRLAVPYITKITDSNFAVIEHTHNPSILI